MTALFIVGLVFLGAGLIALLLSARVKPEKVTPGQEENILQDLQKLIAEYNKLLGMFQERFRIGVLLITVGLSLISIAAYLQATDAKDAAEATTAAVVFVRPA